MNYKAPIISLSIALLTACGGGNSNNGNTPEADPAKPIVHFFPANNGSNSIQLWKTDGTEAGTSMVKVINPGGSSDVKVIGSLDGKAIFTAKDGIHGRELWVTDGTEAGTVLLKDINAGTGNTAIQTFAVAGSMLYFSAYDTVNGTELWKTDGTAAGTILVKDIRPGANGSSVDHMVTIGSTVYFRAYDGGANSLDQLWKSDGTAAGTVSVGASVVPNDMVVSNGTIYFRGFNSANGAELWKSDGTAAGTVMIKDIRAGTTSSSPDDLVIMGGNVYFLAAESNAQGEELWRSDGTAAGTVLVKNINTQTTGSFNSNSSRIRYLTATSNKLFFTARPSSASTIAEIWVSDGTEVGTISLHSAASVSDITVTQNRAYFDGYDTVNGDELWKTDGTIAGTVLIKDVVPGTTGSYFYSLGYYQYYKGHAAPPLLLSDGSVLLTGSTPDKGTELWKTDGTAAGTVLVKDINPDMADGLDN